MVENVILIILAAWLIPLVLFVFYAVTTPVRGARFMRRLLPFRVLHPATRILVAQKTALVLVISFIGVVRFTGGFPGREWVAFGLYTLLVGLAVSVFVYQRRVQLPHERIIRGRKS